MLVWLEREGREWMVLPSEAPTFDTGSALTTPDRCQFRTIPVDAPGAVALFSGTIRVSEDYLALGAHRPMEFSVWGAMARERGAMGGFPPAGAW